MTSPRPKDQIKRTKTSLGHGHDEEEALQHEAACQLVGYNAAEEDYNDHSNPAEDTHEASMSAHEHKLSGSPVEESYMELSHGTDLSPTGSWASAMSSCYQEILPSVVYPELALPPLFGGDCFGI